MNNSWRGAWLVVLLLVLPAVHAVPKLSLGEDSWITGGVRFRSLLRHRDSEQARTTDATIDSLIVYLNAQLYKHLQVELGARYDEINDVRLLDAFLKVELNDYFNVWAGRVIPPSDRANLDGPFFLSAFDFPLVQAYPAIFVGRDTGVLLWGQPGGGRINYSIGAFAGCRDDNPCATGANRDLDFLYAGRFNINFWDTEPGYYTSSTYYGERDLLALGGAFMYQRTATGTALDPSHYLGWNVDLLMEKKLANASVVTLEAAYYDYDLGGKQNPALIDGQGFFALAAYMFPQTVGIGHLQPIVRYQHLTRRDEGSDRWRWETGVNYIIKGHNARLALMYAADQRDSTALDHEVLLGLQLQY